jgi:hypothetical protein
MINPKKALVYGIIAITVVVIIVTMYTALFRSPNDNSLAIKSDIQPIANSNNPSIQQFKNQFCGLNSIPNSNNYIMEYRLPHICEMPLGIAVVDRIWPIYESGTFVSSCSTFGILIIGVKFRKVYLQPISPFDYWTWNHECR